MVKAPLFEPLAGETVSHEVALLLTVQDRFEVTSTLVLEAAADGFHVVGDTLSNDAVQVAYMVVLPDMVMLPPAG